MTKNNIVKDIIETGSEITGGVGGAVLGGLIAGPVGVVIGGASGPILTKMFKMLGTELKSRLLSQREEIRTGAVYTYSIDKILENENEGKKLRADDFFKSTENERSSAEEVFEGIILKAQKEYEENKIKYYGNLLGNIACNESIDKVYANQLIRLAENLTYNQLCTLKVISLSRSKKINLRNNNYRNETSELGRERVTILYDLIDLENRHLIINSKSNVFGLTDINPSQFEPQGNGNALIQLMELNKIPNEHCLNIIQQLSR
jgi:hypothetical protein